MFGRSLQPTHYLALKKIMQSKDRIIETLQNREIVLESYMKLQPSDPVIERVIQKLIHEIGILKWILDEPKK